MDGVYWLRVFQSSLRSIRAWQHGGYFRFKVFTFFSPLLFVILIQISGGVFRKTCE